MEWRVKYIVVWRAFLLKTGSLNQLTDPVEQFQYHLVGLNFFSKLTRESKGFYIVAYSLFRFCAAQRWPWKLLKPQLVSGSILLLGTVLNIEDAKKATIAAAKFLMSKQW
ncbi:uncharacterized protein LOC125421401 [Ziziphus jujuba]|uniref:Uncharacterized protein LOC125421401 n=1 Tax=Ziziphus jujuba TaxID=326968 RepID=A0ABM4AGT9_ZIZJJ|nr:uncharacterized protein LOC125421401 [Ziziphus jujuba]